MWSTEKSVLSWSDLYDDDVEEVPPALADHEGHPLVDRLEGGVGDHEQLLPGFNQPEIKSHDTECMS